MVDKESRDLERHLQRTPNKNQNTPPKRKSIIERPHIHNRELQTDEEKIYSEISLINGQINRMNLGELKNACKVNRKKL